MADKAPPQPQPDHNVLVYVSEFQNATLQTPISSKPVYYRTKFDSGVCDSVRPVESVCTSSSSLDVIENENGEFKLEAVSPPYGWKRILSNGIIVYVSPSNTALSSLEQVRCYVQSEGTCKCGLECPLHLSLAFNFDPKVQSKPCSPTVIAPGDLTKLCNHKRKLLSNIESHSGDSRFAGGDALRRKKRRVVVGGGGGQVIIGGNQVISPAGAVLQPGTAGTGAVPQHAVIGMQQGGVQQAVSNSPPGVPSGATLQPCPTTAVPSPIGVQHGGPVIGIQPGGIQQQSGPPMLGIQQCMQSNAPSMGMQQSVILGMQQNQSVPSMGVQQNTISLCMQQSPTPQPAPSACPSPAASPAPSGSSLPPPSPLSTRMTPPIVPSSRSELNRELNNPQFVKMHQQIPSHEVWREGNYSNGFMDYIPPGGGVLSQSPTTSQDSSILQHQLHQSPSPDLTHATISNGNNQGLSVVQSASPGQTMEIPGVPIMGQNQIMTQGIVQSQSLPPGISVSQCSQLPQGPNLIQNSLLAPASQVLPPGSQVIQTPNQELSVSMAQSPMIQQSTQPTMVRRYPVHMTSHSPSQPTSYHLSQPLQIQYDNSRVCPSYSIKYSKKGNNQLQHQVIEDHQLTMSHPQAITSYHNNIQSSSQHISHQQVVSNHHLIVSSQQNPNGQQQIINTSHQNVDHTSIALQQNINNQQQSINAVQQSLTTSKQSTNSHHHVHNMSNHEVGGNMGRVRTPPWHQNKLQHHQSQPMERNTWTRKNKHKDDSPSFLDDPSGYLAQQTAMLRQVVAGREEEEPKTMASGHTASSNTLTSVLAGRTNTLTVSVGSQEPKPQQQHILVSGNGQFIITSSPKVNPPSPLLLPAPLLLQPIDTVQLPQLVVPSTMHEDIIEKRKSPNKKRKLSPTTSGTTTMLLSPQPQQQVLTILPGKSQLANMIQPLNVVQNFPIQQFLVPSMMMSDGTILQDAVHVNYLPGTGVFSGGQNLLTPTSVVLRAPTSQPQQQQPPKFIHSPNQFVNFTSDISPVVPATTNTTVVQQNTTTIVQQTTMVQQPSPSYILDKPNFILTSDKNNYILSPNGGNNPEKNRSGYVRNSVSTQTQNQVVQVSSTGHGGGLVVTTGNSRGGSPPDTTTLSPADQEVSTSVTSPDPSMVHCVSSSNLHDDSSYHIDTTTSNIPYQTGHDVKPFSYNESSYMHQPLQDKDITQLSSDDCSGKLGLCTTTSDGSSLDNLEESNGMVN